LIALIGTLVDTTAGLTELPAHPNDDERRRARELADHLAEIRLDLLARRLPAPIQFQNKDIDSPGLPLLHELEETVELIPQVFAEPPRTEDEPDRERPPSASLLAHDAFTNPAHLQFGVKGGLAAMLCYMLYTSLDWPGISTSVVTCTFTALSTIGSSR